MSDIAAPKGGGLSTVQDLYDIINGKTTTSSGGTTTTTESAGISKEGMDAMLSNILSGNQGLAAVSSGQRSAGGYGSSVNTMLTNDLLSRSAGQVAALNTTKVNSVSKPVTTSTVGGVTAGGGVKMAGTLAALQGFSKLTNGSDLLKKVKGMLGTEGVVDNAKAITSAAELNAPNGLDMQSDAFVNNSPTFSIDSALGSLDSAIDINNVADTFGDFSNVAASDIGSNVVSDIGASVTDAADFSVADFSPEDFNIADLFSFADGGAVDTSALKKPSVLGTSQFNSIITPSESKASSFTNTANSIASSGSAATPRASGVTKTNDNSGDVGGGGNEGSSNTNGSFGSFGSISGAQIGDLAMGAFSPGLSAVNGLLGLMGIASIGQMATNAFGNVGVNAMVGAAQQAGMDAAADTARGEMNAVANESTDSMDGLMGVTGAFGTASDSSDTSGISNGSESSDGLGLGLSGDSTGGFSGDGLGLGGDTGGLSGDSDGGGGIGGGDGGGGDGFNDGGHISGPGTGVSDSIVAKLSDGEFVLSADVVQAIGIDKLQALQDKYHVPAAVQKLKSIGKGR